ncbi:hypothetical protein AQPE_3832 [Aquipluma nitroreducens]|uniref:Uncharacterized protein n=1 Tax=Aquipluma nitroreducens TaxID=2010828 RepID=A0A5K7SDT9_9BACT|nr:hypothetical protein [Aquipluma nitroreducens]BBE19645.1 hypothetical protein AQPE_3832 [Aquipluma nitroreducens]
MKENSEEDFDSLFVENKRSGVKYIVIIIVLSVLALTSIYAYLSVSSVRDRMKLAQVQAEGSPQINSSLLTQLKEKAWLESRLKMAAGDSIGLSIDLEQHRIQLELKGVVLLSSKIRDTSISGFFRKMDGNVYFSTFGTPLTIQQFKSSIAKNPFKVVQAPKDTIAAMAAIDAAMKKDSLKDENVFWTVKLDRGFDLDIQGIDSIAEAQNKYKFGKGFEFERNLKNITSSFQHILRFSKPSYNPEILISIPENEAKAILRALPNKALVTIRI